MNDDELVALLPWYANDTLDAEERGAVDALLQRSAEARAELAFIRQLARQVRTEPEVQASDLGWQRLKRDLKAKPEFSANRWWRPGLAVAASLVVALQLAILVQPQETDNTQLLSQGTSQPLADHWLLQLEFREETSWQALSQLLLELDARLVDGPSSIGLVRIAVPAGERFDSAEQLLQYLAAQRAVAHAALEGE